MSQRTGPITDSCYLITDWLPHELSVTVLDVLQQEVQFAQMFNFKTPVPRLVAVQHLAVINGDDVSIYRHPSDASPQSVPFTPLVRDLAERINALLGTRLNHALIQLYRNGADSISEHSDKTLDLAPDSKIINASFGASRTMILRLKANRDVELPHKRANETVELPHNSLFCMQLDCNAAWTHAIRRNMTVDGGARISITFREVSTFVSRDHTKIWGSGAIAKTRDEARSVDASDEAWSDLVHAFGRENKGREIEWTKYYGQGSDAYR